MDRASCQGLVLLMYFLWRKSLVWFLKRSSNVVFTIPKYFLSALLGADQNLELKLFIIEVTRHLMNQISYAVSKKQILTFSKMTLIRTTTFWLISSSVSSINMLLWKRNLWEVTMHLLWIESFKKKFMWEVD